MSQHDAKLVQPMRELIACTEYMLHNCLWPNVAEYDKAVESLKKATEQLEKVTAMAENSKAIADAVKRGYQS